MTSTPAGPQAFPASQESRHLAPAEAVNAYLGAFYTADFAAARSVVAEDFLFQGPFLQVSSRGAFFDGAAGLKPIVRGHRLLQQWADGDEVCSWYEMDLETPVKSGSLTMSEWHTVREGKLVSGRIVFDAAAFRVFLPPQ